jgi:hypothetical protein
MSDDTTDRPEELQERLDRIAAMDEYTGEGDFNTFARKRMGIDD